MTTRFVAIAAGAVFAAAGFAQTPPRREDPPKPKQPAAATGEKAVKEAEKPIRRPPPAALALGLRVPEINFQDMPLDQVIDLLRSITSANIVVQWDRLKDHGIARDTPISFHVRNLKVSQLLWLILNQPPLSDVKLAYRADRDMILVSTDEALGGELIVKMYDVQELIMTRLSRPFIALGRMHQVVTSATAQVAAGAVAYTPQTTDYGSGVIYEGEDSDGTTDPNDRENRSSEDERDQRLRELIALIQQTVEPDSWTANGGSGVIIPWRGHIVVRNTIGVHEKLGGPVLD